MLTMALKALTFKQKTKANGDGRACCTSTKTREGEHT